jgi:hypothetical protein
MHRSLPPLLPAIESIGVGAGENGGKPSFFTIKFHVLSVRTSVKEICLLVQVNSVARQEAGMAVKKTVAVSLDRW